MQRLSSAMKGIMSVALFGATIAGVSTGCGGRADENLSKGSSFVPVNPPKLVRSWKVQLPLSEGVTVKKLHLTDNLLFAYTSNDIAYVFNRDSGSQLFTLRINNGNPREPIVTNDYIAIPTESTLEVFNLRGQLQRSIKLGHTSQTGAVVAAGRLAMGVDVAGRGRVLFIDPTKPYNDITPILTMGGLQSRPTARGGLVYAAAGDGKVYAISENLEAAWALPGGAFQTDGPVTADLAVDPGAGGNVYVAGTDSKLYALVAQTGQIRWQFYAGAPLDTKPFVTSDSVYQYVPGAGVVAIDKGGNGNVRQGKWTVPDASAVLAEDAQYAYMLGTGNRVYGIDRKTGRLRFTSERGDLRLFTPNLKDATVFAATPTGEILAAQPVLTAGKMGEIVMNAVKGDEVAAK